MRVVILLALVACKREPAVDCKALAADPGTALQKVMDTTSEPAQVFAVLERCFAPNGDDCERAAVGGQMMPSMAITDGSAGDAAAHSADWKAWATHCRALPADVQKCLVLSYALAHPDCEKTAADARAKLK
jgi:hypothetical protein